MADLKKTAASLRNNGFNVFLFSTANEAAQAALKEIGSASVGFGGSVTIDKMGLYETLFAQGNDVYWHWRCAKENMAQTRLQAHAADVYLTSSNAVTEDGKLVNIDGAGNRLAAIAFGPQKVLIIAGHNKITSNYETAIERIKKFACGPNARRLNLETPCAKTNVCVDCTSPHRLCRAVLTLEKLPMGGREFIVYLVDENLGY